ncbi:MAG: hypothetical protein IJC34_07545 [Lentisphaeria bacterium]|nr:hypothetical protein [Lentisphaeria bacterium]
MMQWIRGAFAGLLAVFCLAAEGTEADLSFFPFVKTVRMSSAAVKDGMGGIIELDAEILTQAGNPLRECRVFTDSGEPVRFVVRKSSGEVRKTRRVPVEAELAMTGGNTGLIRTRGKLSPGPYTLEIWPGNAYFAKFLCVTARMPSGKERKVLDRASVFSFAPPYPMVRNMVEFFAPAQAELTVEFSPGQDLPQKILRPDDIINEAWCTEELTDVRIRLSRKETCKEIAPLINRYSLEYQVDHADHLSIISIQAPLVPLTGFRMSSRTPFLFRQVKIYGGSNPVDMTLLGEGTFSRIAPGDLLQVSIPESRFRYYELHIDNRDKSPLDDMEFSAEGPRLELVTEAPAENLLKLAYGRKAGPGEFPRHLPEKQVRCLVGKGRRNLSFLPPEENDFPVVWYWVAGGIILAGGGFAAGYMFFRNCRNGVKK